MTNNDWLDEIFANWNCFYKDDKIVDCDSKTLKQQILDYINKNYVPKEKVTDAFKCEFGHEVYGHKTVDGYCCACEADIAFMDKCITRQECEKRVLDAYKHGWEESGSAEDLPSELLERLKELKNEV